MASNMIKKGCNASSTNSLKSLIDTIDNINVGKKWSCGHHSTCSIPIPSSKNSSVKITMVDTLKFKPDVILINTYNLYEDKYAFIWQSRGAYTGYLINDLISTSHDNSQVLSASCSASNIEISPTGFAINFSSTSWPDQLLNCNLFWVAYES